MYISCVFFKEFLYFKKPPNPVQTLNNFSLFYKLLFSEQQTVGWTLLVLFATRWFIGTKSPNSGNLLCSDKLEDSVKSFPIITEKWNAEENTPINLPQAISLCCTPDVQACCFITLWVGVTVAWAVACIYDPGFKYLETIDVRSWNL